VQQARLYALEIAEKNRLEPEASKRRVEFVDERAAAIVQQDPACKPERARQIAERMCGGILLQHINLTFDVWGDVTVAEVLANPEKFDRATLADPLEGVPYGRCKAMIMRRHLFTRELRVKSFAHGGMDYEIKHDAASIVVAIAAASEAEAADVLVELVNGADINPAEEEDLRDLASSRSKKGKGVIKARIKAAKEEQRKYRADEEKAWREARRTDPRPRLLAPRLNAERIPVLMTVDEVLSDIVAEQPPMRNAEGVPIEARCRRPVFLHDFLQDTANYEESTTDG
jgi:hypothetical protein